MEKLYFLFIQIILLVLSVPFSMSFSTLVLAKDPTLHAKLNSVVIKMDENPYFDKWTVELESGGEVVTIKCPTKAELPENMMVKFTIQYSDMDIPDHEILLCDAFNDETIGKGMVAKGVPQNIFPKSCKVQKGSDYVIKKWSLPVDKIPPGVPDGKITGTVTLFEPEKEPYIEILIEGELFHKVPGFGK